MNKNYDDPLYEEVKIFIFGLNEVSITLIQRKFRIGYNRSTRIIGMLESDGIIGSENGTLLRKVILNK